MGKISVPPCYENWIAFLDGKKSNEAYECALFTDARIAGNASKGYGPYQFLNAAPMPSGSGQVRPAIVLRVEWHLPNNPEYNAMDETDTGYYHGGDANDEIAALASLALGARIKAGGMTRRFRNGWDPRGLPCAWESYLNPIFIKRGYGAVIPNALKEHLLTDLKQMQILPKMTPNDVTALIRAARLYQEALWIAESDAALSWLLLISAIEVAANYRQCNEESPAERLTASKPRLAALLKSSEMPNLLEQVAVEIVSSLGSTKKFIDFLTAFLPPPPLARPPERGQISWEARDLKRIFNIVYEYRSRALHGGTPFPMPMCQTPSKHSGWEVPAEKPTGLAMGCLGGVWLAEDTPILLHTFEYIARGALLKWWDSITQSEKCVSSAQQPNTDVKNNQ